MDKSIVAGEQWKIRSNHRPILSEEEHDALVSWLEDEEGGRFTWLSFHEVYQAYPVPLRRLNLDVCLGGKLLVCAELLGWRLSWLSVATEGDKSAGRRRNSAEFPVAPRSRPKRAILELRHKRSSNLGWQPGVKDQTFRACSIERLYGGCVVCKFPFSSTYLIC